MTMPQLFSGLATLLLVCLLNPSGTYGEERTLIAHGQCKHPIRYGPSVKHYCSIPGTTPDMELDVELGGCAVPCKCIKEKSYGITADNTRLWVNNSCRGLFKVYKLTSPTPAPSQTPSESSDGPHWEQWGEWGECSVSCGGGLRQRYRQCSSGVDNDCVSLFSSAMATERCNTQDCSQDDADTPSQAGNGQGYVSFHPQCGIANSNYRIVGGKAAEECQFPWMVMVHNTVEKTICGGTILDEYHIMTAGHCVVDQLGNLADAGVLYILSGSSEMPIGVSTEYHKSLNEEIFLHESYNDQTLVNDIAIVRLQAPLEFDDCHRPACLADNSKTPQQASNCWAMGWGLHTNGPDAQVQSQLQYVREEVKTDQECSGLYRGSDMDTAFCANGEDAGSCQGDSGGPLVCEENDRYIQYGIVSAGYRNKCGLELGLYTRVGAFVDDGWINRIIATGA